MDILHCRLLTGPNVWARFPVLEALVDVRSVKDRPTDHLAFDPRLTQWLSHVADQYCHNGDRITFVDLLRDRSFQADSVQRIAVELQSLAGSPVSFGQAQPTSVAGVYQLALQYDDATLAHACLEAARHICLAAVEGKEIDVAAEIRRLRELGDEARLGPSTRSIVEAARKRGIPAIRLSEGNLVQLGYGARQRRILAAETDHTSAVGETVAQDKELTRSLLRKIGVPVPLGRSPKCASQAWQIACELGLPVVVKPRYGSHGRGVATNLTSRHQVVAACESIVREGSAVIVEQFIPGADYRLLVMGNRLVAAARRDPPMVFGDGVRTVGQLVDAVNADPRRAEGHAAPLTKIAVDSIAREVLAEQGLLLDSVPAESQRVLIRRNGNLSTGGTATDVTAEVHPDVATRAVEAARMVGLDVAGIDILVQDIGRPLEEQGGAVIEVNACPGLRMHLYPSYGQPRAVGEAIVELMFAAGERARIPIVGVTADVGNSTTSRLVAHIVEQTGTSVGLAVPEGLIINRRSIDSDTSKGSARAQALLLNPLVESAIFEIDAATMLEEGLPFDLCDVAIIEATGADLTDATEAPDDQLSLNRCLLDAVAPCGVAVLNADDSLVSAIADERAAEIIYFSHDEHHPRMFSHRLNGGRIVFVRDHCILAAAGAQEAVVAPLDDLGFTYEGLVASQVDSALAAAAGCWALGISWRALRAGLESFASDLQPVVRWAAARQ